MMIKDYKIEKVVVSMGLGNKPLLEIQKIKEHFENLFKEMLSTRGERSQKMVITKCVKSNAKFKIRKGNPCGLKVSLRKNALVFLRFFNSKINFSKDLTYNNGVLAFGIKDHRLLRLERYNYEAPEYGFSVNIVLRPVSNRIHTRRINRSKSKVRIPSGDICRGILQDYVSK